MADLSEGMGLHRFHQRGEDIFAVTGGGLEVGQALASAYRGCSPSQRGQAASGGLEGADVGDLGGFFGLGAAD